MAADFSLTEFAAFLSTKKEEIEAEQRDALEKAAAMIEAEAKRVIGTYDYGWPPLAPATVADRVAQGYPADEPLLRTGAMRDSIETVIIEPGKLAEIGSSDPVAVAQELGTSTIPARSFLLAAAIHELPKIQEMVGDRVAAVFRR